MDLWGFLQWLWSQISKVIDWFSDGYWTLRNAARDALNNAISWASWALGQAKNYVIDRFNELKAWANGWYSYLYDYASNVYNRAYDKVISYYNLVSTALSLVKAYLIGEISAVYNRAVSTATTLIEAVKVVFTLLIETKKNELYNTFKALLALIAFIPTILSLTKPTIASNLLTLAQSYLSMISTFFSDPVGFILGLIWTRFTQYLCFALGYGLGSVETALPPIPVWGTGGAAGAPGTPSPIPPGTGELTRPVSPLYVSGYTFGVGHYGTDFGIGDGQEIRAAHAGEVTFADFDTSGYGIRVDISGNPYWSRYGHNKQLLVRTGDHVSAGQVISYGDSTGNSTGPHLHFELKLNGSYVDPVLYL